MAQAQQQAAPEATTAAPSTPSLSIVPTPATLHSLFVTMWEASSIKDDVAASAMVTYLTAAAKWTPSEVQASLTAETVDANSSRKQFISRVRAVYQAKLNGLVIEGKGVNQLIEQASAILKEKQLLPNGKQA